MWMIRHMLWHLLGLIYGAEHFHHYTGGGGGWGWGERERKRDAKRNKTKEEILKNRFADKQDVVF